MLYIWVSHHRHHDFKATSEIKKLQTIALYLYFCTRICQHIPRSLEPNMCTHTHTLFLFILTLTSFTQLVSWGSLEYPGLGGFSWLPLSTAASHRSCCLLTLQTLVPHYCHMRNERAAQTLSVVNLRGPSTASLCINISILVCIFHTSCLHWQWLFAL